MNEFVIQTERSAVSLTFRMIHNQLVPEFISSSIQLDRIPAAALDWTAPNQPAMNEFFIDSEAISGFYRLDYL